MRRNTLSLNALGLWLGLGMAVLGLWLLLADPLPLQALRHQGHDQYQRWHPRAYVPAPVRIVDIDEASLARLGQWPWPRTRLADLLARLRAAGAAAVGFDVLFAEADRTSPNAVVDAWPLPLAERQRLRQLPDHDAVFAQALQAGGDAVLGFALRHEAAPGGGAREPAVPSRFVWVGGPAAPQALHGFASAVPALDALDRAAAGHGALTFVPDADGVVRRVPLALRLGERPVPSLVAEVLRVGQGASNHLLSVADHGRALTGWRSGAVAVPTTPRGELWLHYTAPVPGRYLPAWQVLDGGFDPAQVAGQLVLVGSSAQGLMDLRLNPLGRVMPGVEAHAQALEQALTGHFLQRPDWARALEALVLAAGTLLLAALATRARAWVGAAVAGVALAALLGGGWWAFRRHGLLLDSFTPALVWLATFVAASLAHHLWSERQQRFIRNAFARYVSPNRVDYLVAHPDTLALGGQRQTCSFVFTDLAGFTGLMEKTDPAQALSLLNRYLEGMVEIAFRHQGTLDRIVGDAVAVMFSAPVPQPDHAQRALDCALDMHAFATRYALDLQARGVPFGHTRLGVHSGEVLVGNFGGEALFDYRALGDAVNTASRLEGVNKHLGTRLCVSAVTLADCRAVSARPVGRLVLVGKTEPLPVFEPLTPQTPPGYAPLVAYDEAYHALADGDPGAAERFARLHAAHPDDPLVRLHHTRLQRLTPAERAAQTDRLVMDAK
ncbi:CHASE2 domain-containing protein [Aquabacterium sp. A08]|uniref:CHASE2 domain-containing protein n=1 Tax=Aquabacterium sp. A08 TaxID=2718532 RepID=UPI00142075DF|nr:adenylate/guanylate cyclase domain-containing protein [Aquabacterium sp. A08]NIC41582.1 adenylate/guanylate cyclase domain-containing protein [Aquabacterium sp. A08]